MTSRREEKDRRRAERLAAEQAAAEQARRRRMYSIVVGGVLAVAAVAAIVAVAATGGGDGDGGGPGGLPTPSQTYTGAVTPPAQADTNLFSAARRADCVLRNPVIEGRTHEPDQDKVVRYKTDPPTSGNHDPIPAQDGVYDVTPTRLTFKNFVHTLEHGRIEIQYDPSLPKRRIDQLGGLFNDDPYHMVMFPNRRMPYEVAATAWGHLLGCKKVTDETFDALRGFRDRYRDQGPEQVA